MSTKRSATTLLSCIILRTWDSGNRCSSMNSSASRACAPSVNPVAIYRWMTSSENPGVVTMESRWVTDLAA